MKDPFSKVQNDSKNNYLNIFPNELYKFILKSLFDGTQSSIFLFSPDFRIIFFNKHAQRVSTLFGGSRLVCGESVFRYRNSHNREFIEIFKFQFDKAVETKKLIVSEREVSYLQMKFWIRTEYTPVYTSESELIGVLINIQDISDRKKAEYSSEQKQIQLDQIAWLHSHETRKPLATLLGLLSIFDKKSLTKDNTELIKLMEATATELEAVIKRNVNLANRSH